MDRANQHMMSGAPGPHVGILGVGRLGSVVLGALPEHCLVSACARDRRAVVLPDGRTIEATSRLADVAAAEVILLAVPAAGMFSALERLAPHLRAGTLVVNMATEVLTPPLRALAPDCRLIAAKIIGQAAEMARGAPVVVVVDHASPVEFAMMRELLGRLGMIIVGSEDTVLATNTAVAEEIVRAEALIRSRLADLQLPAPAIEIALTTMAVGVLCAVSTGTGGPFLRSVMDRYSYSQSGPQSPPPVGPKPLDES